MNKISLAFGVVWVFIASGLFEIAEDLGVSVVIVGSFFVWLSIFGRKKRK